MNAIKLLKKHKKTFKAYKIDKIKGGMDMLLREFRKDKDLISYDVTHTTRPIIFYKGQFVGGFTALKEQL